VALGILAIGGKLVVLCVIGKGHRPIVDHHAVECVNPLVDDDVSRIGAGVTLGHQGLLAEVGLVIVVLMSAPDDA
jgi:hypothetical protein